MEGVCLEPMYRYCRTPSTPEYVCVYIHEAHFATRNPLDSQEVAEFCLFNQDFGRKYVWSCGILSFPASGSLNRGRGIPVIVIETFHDGKPFPALKK